MTTANEAILDRIIRRQVYLERYKTSVVRRIADQVQADELAARTRMLGLIEQGTTERNLRRQERLINELAILHRDLVEGAVVGPLDDELRAYVETEGRFAASLLNNTTPAVIETVVPAASQMYAAVYARPWQGKLLRNEYKKLLDNDAAIVREHVRNGFVTGQSTDQIIRGLVGTRANNYADGAVQATRNSIKALVRTSIQHTASVARREVFDANARLIKGYQHRSTLDLRTSDICIALSNKVYRSRDQVRWPPLHFNCRSTIIPLVKSWRELGLDGNEIGPGFQSSLDGGVPADINYEQWLRRQSREDQIEVLGDARYKAWRQGKLSLRDLVNASSLRPLTLDELKTRGKL